VVAIGSYSDSRLSINIPGKLPFSYHTSKRLEDLKSH
jgi:hypothetical protein